MTVTEPAAESVAPSNGPVVKVTDAWKLHKLGDEIVRALVNVTLEVHPGEFVCLMGPSGSGKTTLLNIIGGLDRPTKGIVEITGRDTSKITESQYAALRHDAIGYIFQSYNLIPFLSAVENVELPLMFEPYDRKALRQRAIDLLNLVGLGHRLDHQPAKLSGGEQQRTAIARALVHDPRIIIADEPTGNLDPVISWEIIQLLLRINEMGVTILMATHDAEIVTSLRRRIVALEDGRIIRDDTAATYHRED